MTTNDSDNEDVVNANKEVGATQDEGDATRAKKRRRLSKRQRKALKRKQKQMQKKFPGKHDDEETPNEVEKSSSKKSKKKKKSQSTANPSEQKNKRKSKEEDSDDDEEGEASRNDHPDEDDVDLMDQEEEIRLQYMKSYQPIEIPTQHAAEEFLKQSHKGESKKNSDTIEDEGGCRTLGKWFPNAILVKSRINYTNTGKLILLNDSKSHKEILKEDDVRVTNPKSSLVLFYQYTTSADSTAKAPWDRSQLQLLMAFLAKIARQRHLGGRIRVAPEGVNATISAVDTRECTSVETLRHFAEDLKRFDENVFANTDFKYLDDLPADRHFKAFKILPVQELVFYDIGEAEAPLQQQGKHQAQQQTAGGEGGGVHLDAKEYHQMLKKDNTVVIDVRNHYETILGRFDGQQQQTAAIDDKDSDEKPAASKSDNEQQSSTSGAEYIDPKMRKSTDFKSWLATPETQEKLQNKTVLMYCTGGIRCERASAYLKSQMGDQVDGVYQLKGGIERYLKTFKDGGFWRGKNFVFDKREAVGVENPEGDGGVIRKQAKKKQKRQQSDEANETPAKCCVCGDPWDRYVGKKKCSTCGVPVLMCDKCMSLKPDKTPGMELKVRCPLCVKENITVLASQVEFTDNGIKSKMAASQSSIVGKKSRRDRSGSEDKVKAADSVLKWGGGHANKKKQLKKAKRRLCQFGAECIRKDCFFYHPERSQSNQDAANAT